MQRGILLVVVRWLCPKGVDDSDSAPVLPKSEPGLRSYLSACLWTKGAPVTMLWLGQGSTVLDKDSTEALPHCVTTAVLHPLCASVPNGNSSGHSGCPQGSWLVSRSQAITSTGVRLGREVVPEGGGVPSLSRVICKLCFIGKNRVHGWSLGDLSLGDCPKPSLQGRGVGWGWGVKRNFRLKRSSNPWLLSSTVTPCTHAPSKLVV